MDETKNQELNSLLELIFMKIKFLGWNQTRLMEKTGLSRATINRFWNNQGKITVENLMVILKTLDLLGPSIIKNDPESLKPRRDGVIIDKAMSKYPFLKYIIQWINESAEVGLRSEAFLESMLNRLTSLLIETRDIKNRKKVKKFPLVKTS